MKTTKEDLLEALRRSKKALHAFEAMPPSHQKRYLAFVEEAKKPETIARRIQRCVEELARAKPGAAGYSGTPLLKKLGIAAGHRVVLLGAPAELPAALASMPASVTVRTTLGTGACDVIVLFARARSDLERRFEKAARRLDPAGGLWVAWPKRASGVATDLTEDDIREIALAAGLVDNKVCAIDEVWSGLRCVYRRKDRPR